MEKENYLGKTFIFFPENIKKVKVGEREKIHNFLIIREKKHFSVLYLLKLEREMVESRILLMEHK